MFIAPSLAPPRARRFNALTENKNRMEPIKSELLALLRRQDLLRAALLAGSVHDANFDVECYVERVLEIAARAWQRTGQQADDPARTAQAIAETLAIDVGLSRGDRMKTVLDDPDRHYLHRLLERRTGSPIAVTILFACIAQQLKLPLRVVALPSQYLIRVDDVVRPFYMDPFDDGKTYTEEDLERKIRSAMQRGKLLSTSLYEVVGPKQLVGRLLTQLKQSYLMKSRALEALRTVELLTAIYPNSPELTRDRGILYCEIEYFSHAVRDLKHYLKARPNASDVQEVKKLASMLKGCREIVN
jgi:regulator of sirC expression with transglutaminase-like and TPR domain